MLFNTKNNNKNNMIFNRNNNKKNIMLFNRKKNKNILSPESKNLVNLK